MNTILANEDDQKLSMLLRAWKVEAKLPPRFQEQVWRRITLLETHPERTLRGLFMHWLEVTFTRPAVAVLLFVGLTTGYLKAQDRSAQAELQWRTLYVQSVDPYQVPRNQP
jgi:hypothetical protein